MAKLHSSCGDARNFEQVIYQVAQMINLPPDNAAGLFAERRFDGLGFEQLCGVCNRGERCAEFVAKHRKKIVLNRFRHWHSGF